MAAEIVRCAFWWLCGGKVFSDKVSVGRMLRAACCRSEEKDQRDARLALGRRVLIDDVDLAGDFGGGIMHRLHGRRPAPGGWSPSNASCGSLETTHSTAPAAPAVSCAGASVSRNTSPAAKARRSPPLYGRAGARDHVPDGAVATKSAVRVSPAQSRRSGPASKALVAEEGAAHGFS